MTSPADSNYRPDQIEAKWQQYWERHDTFLTCEDPAKPKYYVLDMFPYPSGDGLHVGHPEGYTATDIVARYKRMQGYAVLHPMGWDAFGLPAEQHAVKTGTHPRDTTAKNIANFKRQLKSIGFSYDWQREINTTEPDYYKWTQWIFLQLYKKGLAYEANQPVNWCPALGTVLANEEVVDGKSEIGGHPVEKKNMRQWVLKITAYADRLLEDLEELDWPDAVKDMQRNWVGKSIGADVHFSHCEQPDHRVTVFTTRPDTLFGVSFLVLAPEHPLVETFTTSAQSEAIARYKESVAAKSDRDRQIAKTKTGVFTGGFASHPVTGHKVPVYIADYVMMSYGHGAVMAVPGHDQRDFEFAEQFELSIPVVVTKAGQEPPAQLSEAFTSEGVCCNSDFLNGLSSADAKQKIIAWLESEGKGKATITYKLRDWLFSRQRYWGEPIPILHRADGVIEALSEDELPLTLPDLEEFKPSPSGESPLANASQWLAVEKDGHQYSRETNTMPQWGGSCWYYLRYMDPTNSSAPVSKEREAYWQNVDLYIGGMEHAVLHLLYARFWHKVLYDIGVVTTKEPFKKLVNQGMILGGDGQKMSKSRGNVINPDQVIADWGADSLRLYEMFMGPLEASKPWQTSGISGCHRFLKRLWKLFVGDDGHIKKQLFAKQPSAATVSVYHQTVKKVGEDIEELRFNTAISALMEAVNHLYKEPQLDDTLAKGLVLLVSPFAPHIAEELWHKLKLFSGQGDAQASLAYEPWPSFDESKIVADTVTMAVQVNGKARAMLEIQADWDKDQILSAAKQLPNAAKHLDGKTIIKEIYVPQKIINFVAK